MHVIFIHVYTKSRGGATPRLRPYDASSTNTEARRLLQIARLVDMSEHRKALLQGRILRHAHLRAQIGASSFDRSMCAALNFCVTHQ